MRKELAVYFRQLAVAYRSGIPITEGLRMAATGCRDERLRSAAGDVERRVRSGEPLGPAIAAHPEVFTELEAALVAVGEATGGLDRNLDRLAERRENAIRDTERLVTGLIYPAILVVAALFLPRLYVWVQHSFWAYLWSVFTTAMPLFAGLGLAGGAVFFWRRSSPESFDRVLLDVPVIGSALKKLALSRFSDSLAALYSGGVEIRRALRLSVRALGNRHLERRCAGMGELVTKGATLAEALTGAGVFPHELIAAVAVAERTGELDPVLSRLARHHQEEADQAITRLLILLPIAIYIAVAIGVAIIVISAFGAYFRLVGGV